MTENQPPSKQSDSKQDAAKSEQPVQEQPAEVDAKTAAKNRSAFLKRS